MCDLNFEQCASSALIYFAVLLQLLRVKSELHCIYALLVITQIIIETLFHKFVLI